MLFLKGFFSPHTKKSIAVNGSSGALNELRPEINFSKEHLTNPFNNTSECLCSGFASFYKY